MEANPKILGRQSKCVHDNYFPQLLRPRRTECYCGGGAGGEKNWKVLPHSHRQDVHQLLPQQSWPFHLLSFLRRTWISKYWKNNHQRIGLQPLWIFGKKLLLIQNHSAGVDHKDFFFGKTWGTQGNNLGIVLLTRHPNAEDEKRDHRDVLLNSLSTVFEPAEIRGKRGGVVAGGLSLRAEVEAGARGGRRCSC